MATIARTVIQSRVPVLGVIIDHDRMRRRRSGVGSIIIAAMPAGLFVPTALLVKCRQLLQQQLTSPSYHTSVMLCVLHRVIILLYTSGTYTYYAICTLEGGYSKNR